MLNKLILILACLYFVSCSACDDLNNFHNVRPATVLLVKDQAQNNNDYLVLCNYDTLTADACVANGSVDIGDIVYIGEDRRDRTFVIGRVNIKKETIRREENHTDTLYMIQKNSGQSFWGN